MITVTLPWPVREVWPNFRQSHHFRQYCDQVAAQRATAKRITEALSATPADHAVLMGDGKIPVRVDFYPPDRRYRDDDGMIGALKSGRDGIADALNVNDRRFRSTYHFHDAEKPGRIVVSIGE